MGITFNRRPYSVSTPNKDDIKNYFLTQSNWKGVVKNKNFLTVDQESFEDALNVYVDEEYVLKSRPSVKKLDLLFMFNDDIVDVHFISDVLTIYYLTNHRLLIVLQYGIDITTRLIEDVSDYRLLKVKDFVLLFTDDNIRKIDAEGKFTDADIYIPKTKLISLDGSESNLESKNIFTDEEITVYLYNSESENLDTKTKLLGKKVKLTVDDEILEFTFTHHTFISLFHKGLNISTDLKLRRFLYKTPSGEKYYYEYFPFAISNAGTFAYYNRISKEIFYSVDGKIFRLVCILPDEYIFNSTDTDRGLGIELKFCRDNPAILTISHKYGEGAGLSFLSVESDLPDGSFRYNELTLIALIASTYGKYSTCTYDAIDFDTYAYVDGPNSESDSGYDFKIYTKGEPKTIILFSDKDLQGQVRVTNLAMNNNFVYCSYVYSYTFAEALDQPIYECKIQNINNTSESFIANEDYPIYEFFTNDENGYIWDFNKMLYYFNGQSVIPLTVNNFYTCTKNYVYLKDGVYTLKDGMLEKLSSLTNLNLKTISTGLSNRSNEPYIISNNGDIYTTFTGTLEIELLKEGSKKYILPEHFSQLNNLYMSKGNTLYISQFTENDALYFPEINKQTFPYDITNLHPLSETEMGIFLYNQIWYSYLTEQGYAYKKSRLDLGCKQNNDIETSFDGKYTLFSTDRGFAALSYQDFVASTEQSVIFISDNIQSLYNEFKSRGSVKLVKYENYLILYNDEDILLYDFRNGSWWPWKIKDVSKFVRDGDSLYLLKNASLCNLDYTSIAYYDDNDGGYEDINWYVTSQKLHLNANNYNKHIVNMTFSSIENDDTTNSLSMNLKVKNYRHFVDEGKEEVFDYRVELIRTFVKRLNYAKVREFQYTLSMDSENAIKLPLSLSAITIKYKIGGQVR